MSVPLTPLSTFMGRWVLGETLCKLFPSSQVRGRKEFLVPSVDLCLSVSVYLSLHVHLHPHSHRSGQVSYFVLTFDGVKR